MSGQHKEKPYGMDRSYHLRQLCWTLIEKRSSSAKGIGFLRHISFQKHDYALLTENRDPLKLPTNFLNNCSQPGHRLLFLN